MLGHRLHNKAIISKFKLGSAYKTDFAYLTKCTDYWELVLIEIEDSKKKIFTSNLERPIFAAGFNKAFDQVKAWEAYLDENKIEVLSTLKKFRRPLDETPVHIKYVLIIGRDIEKTNNIERRKLLAGRNSENIRIMTYDSVISTYLHEPSKLQKMILSQWGDSGFCIKYIPEHFETNIFSHLGPDSLKISSENVELLKQQGYQMDLWKSGQLLIVDGKHTLESVEPLNLSKKLKTSND